MLSLLILRSDGCKKTDGIETAHAEMALSGVSISTTKPSDVWPPRPGNHFALDCGGTTLKTVDGIETRTVELRGWLIQVESAANPKIDGDWRDWTYAIKPDVAWCEAHGIDMNKLLKVGNALFTMDADGVPGYTYSPYAAVGEPGIKIEMNGWVDSQPPVNPLITQIPADWGFTHASAPDTKWAFDPVRPMSWQPELTAGQYVRVVGSIVSDAPHQSEAGFPLWFLKTFGVELDPAYAATFNDAKNIWGAGRGEHDPDHAARWSEVHPPDIISVLINEHYKERTVRLIEVAVCEDKGIGNPGRSLDVDLLPIGPKPTPNSRADVIEMVGPETLFGTITEGQVDGNGAFTGATMTKFPNHVHLHVKVQANTNSNGKFKALYKVFWTS